MRSPSAGWAARWTVVHTPLVSIRFATSLLLAAVTTGLLADTAYAEGQAPKEATALRCRDQAAACSQALVAGDYATFVACTYPKVVQMNGGPEGLNEAHHVGAREDEGGRLRPAVLLDLNIHTAILPVVAVKVGFFETSAGRSQAREFLQELEVSDRAQTDALAGGPLA